MVNRFCRKNVTFAVGDKFDSYDALQMQIDQYANENFVVICHRDTRTLEKAVSQKKVSADRAKKNPVI